MDLQLPKRNTTSKSTSAVLGTQSKDADEALHAAWRTLFWWEWLAIVATVGTVAVLALWQLPLHVCFGDGGELQLAATVLGIAHPPGYAGYVSIWHLLTFIPGVDPAYVVSLSCLTCGLVALTLGSLIQVRLGVNAFLATTAMLVLTMHPRVWTNLTAPEVYMPTLVLMVAVVYVMMRYSVIGRRRDLLLAAGLFGLALSNRPPVLFMAPFLVAANWLAEKQMGLCVSERFKSLGLAVLCAIIPGVYSVTYLLVRDQPTTTFNYLDVYNSEYHELPSVDEGWQARIARTHWLMSGQQFKYLMGNNWKGIRSKFRWLRSEFVGRMRMPAWPVETVLSYRKILLPTLIGLTFAGFMVVVGRSQVSACLLLGLCISNLVFVCYYRIYGDAADILPLMFTMAVFCGNAMSMAIGRGKNILRRQAGSLMLLVAMLIFTVIDAPERGQSARNADATDFLREADLASLPDGSLVCSNWGNATPLWYANYVLQPDQNFEVFNAWESHWFYLLQDQLDRPIFAAVKPPSWNGYQWVPIRNLWRLTKE